MGVGTALFLVPRTEFTHTLPLHLPSDASVKDMEAAAVAWAAELYAVPYFALKVVTDIGTYVFL